MPERTKGHFDVEKEDLIVYRIQIAQILVIFTVLEIRN